MKKRLPLHHRAVINRVNHHQFHTSFTNLSGLFGDHELQCEGITPHLQAEGGAR
jgi:hypothetical protein